MSGFSSQYSDSLQLRLENKAYRSISVAVCTLCRDETLECQGAFLFDTVIATYSLVLAQLVQAAACIVTLDTL